MRIACHPAFHANPDVAPLTARLFDEYKDREFPSAQIVCAVEVILDHLFGYEEGAEDDEDREHCANYFNIAHDILDQMSFIDDDAKPRGMQ